MRNLPTFWEKDFTNFPEYLDVVTDLGPKVYEEEEEVFDLLGLPKYIQWAMDFSFRLMEAYMVYFETSQLFPKFFQDRRILRQVIFENLDYWTLLALAGYLPKYLKYWTSKFFCDILSQFEKPKLPDFKGIKLRPFLGFPFAGKIHLITYVRPRERVPNRKLVEFFYGLLDLKKSSLDIHPSHVDKEVQEAFNKLTTPLDSEQNDRMVGIRNTIRRISALLVSTCRRTCGKFPDIVLPSCLPTTGGLENGRKNGGCYGHLQQHLRDYSSSTSGNFHLCNMANDDSVFEVKVPFNPNVEKCYYRHLDDITKDFPSEIPVKLIGLPEPFKVRTISVGPVDIYAQSRRYQKLFWHLLSHSPIFDLTRGPLKHFHLRRLYDGNPFRLFKIATHQVSADYIDATNSIYKRVIEETAEDLFDLLEIPYHRRAVLLKTLTRCLIKYRDQIRKQKRGQLMGGPLSFVVLCLINAGANTYVIEKVLGKRIKIPTSGELVPFLVNGDDYMGPLPPDEYQFWREVLTSIGLEPSVGKNYIHPYFGTINSTLVEFERSTKFEPQTRPARIYNHLKLSLAFPPKDESVFIKDDTFDWRRISLKSNLERLILDQDARKKDLILYALRKHKKFLSVLPKEIPYCVSPSLGGIGIPLFDHKQISESHRYRVAYLKTQPPKRGGTLVFPGEVTKVDSLIIEKENQLLDQLGIPWEPGTEKPLPKDESVLSRWFFLFEFEKLKGKLSVLQTLRKWSYRIREELRKSNRLRKVLRPSSSTTCQEDVKPWRRSFPPFTFDLGLVEDSFVQRTSLFEQLTHGTELFI